MRNRTTKMHRIIFMIVMLVFAASPALSAGKDTSVAVVNGTPISKATFDREYNRVRQGLAQSGQTPTDAQLPQIKNRILDNLIDVELLYQDSKKQGVKVDDAQVNTRIEAVKKQFPGDAEFKKALEKTMITEKDLREQLKREIAIKQFIDTKIGKNITATEKEAKEFYDKNPQTFKQPEQVKASHILIKVDEKADKATKEKARKTIEDIQKKVKKGGDFAALAKESSQCPSAPKGGDLGYFRRGQMVKPFEDAAFAMKQGQVSDIVETQFGYHLIKVTDKKPEGVISFAEVKEKIMNHVKMTKTKAEVDKYVEGLKKKAKITKNLS
ncbi:MAG: peptidylprolyl isomerase [Deltaproteobacteria bacterium]|nr:peptidylprolyl isomerase [Deltaproteobacteria bacterium]